MKPNIAKIKKSQLDKMNRWRCPHSHSGIEHYDCWLEANPDTERIGFFDLECSNLSADFGIILSYAIADLNSDKIYKRAIKVSELRDRKIWDKNVVKQCIKDMGNFDRLVTYYGTKFDLPYVRTRAVTMGLDFPEYGSVLHSDVYYIIKFRFRLSRSRLDNALRSLTGSSEKTFITPQIWIGALTGQQDDIDYIEDHNIRDVTELKRLYLLVEKYARTTERSI